MGTEHPDRARQHSKQVLSTLSPGDLIKFIQDIQEEWAVYIGEKDGVAQIMRYRKETHSELQKCADNDSDVITRFLKFSKNTRTDNDCIQICPFWEVAGSSRVENANEKDRIEETNSTIEGSQVVKGAKAFKKRAERERTTNLFHNSEHFAKFCRYGKLVTQQSTHLQAAQMSTEEIANLNDLKTFVRVSKPKSNKVQHKIDERNRKLLSTLKEGDLIKFRRGGGLYHHWAVYIGKNDNEDDAVIHWWSRTDSMTSKKGASIMITSFQEAAKGCIAVKGNDASHEKRYIDGQKVAIRAKVKQRLVQEGVVSEKYHVWKNNCEYFAKWCRYGFDTSDPDQRPSIRVRAEDFVIGDQSIRTDVSERSDKNQKCEHEILVLREEVSQLRAEIKNLQEYSSQVDQLKQSIFNIYIALGVLMAFVLILFVLNFMLFGR